MQISGKFRADGENALAVLALGLTEELLPPAAHHLEAGLKGFQDLDGLAVTVQQIAGCGIQPHGVFEGTDVISLLGLSSTAHDFHGVDAGNCHGQQTHSGQHRVTAAHIGGNHEGLPALFGSHLTQCALGGVGDGVCTLPGAVGAVLALQHPAQGAGSDGGLGGGAGLGNDGDGEILALQQTLQLIPCTGGQAVAGIVDLGIALALADVVVAALHQLDGSTGAQVAAADTDDHEYIGGLADALCGGTDAADLIGLLGNRQIQPAQEIVTLATALGQGHVGIKDLLLGCQQIGQRQLSPHIGNVNFNHKKVSVLSFLSHFYVTAKPPQTQ